jgi:Stage II sporulation protein E (SpoIIE)
MIRCLLALHFIKSKVKCARSQFSQTPHPVGSNHAGGYFLLLGPANYRGNKGTPILELTPGSRFVLYSDGVSEATNLASEEYGASRSQGHFDRSESSVNSLLHDIYQFSEGAPLADDATVVLIDTIESFNVTVSALDARGLYTNEVTASERGPGAGGPNLEYRRSAMRRGEDPMSELAEGTGGTFFHNSNDLSTGLKLLAESPTVVYLLQLSFDDAASQSGYHRLKVKVNRDGLEVQARRGYSVPPSEKTKK